VNGPRYINRSPGPTADPLSLLSPERKNQRKKQTMPTPVNESTGYDDIDATIAGLRALAVWRTEHPEINGGHLGDSFIIHRSGDHAAVVRALADGARIGEVKKYEVRGGEGLHVSRKFGGGVSATYAAEREQVCTRRVVGTETVEVPDPDAPLVTIERDVVEWDCEPILAKSW